MHKTFWCFFSVPCYFWNPLCLKPCHASSALGSPGRTSMPMTLLSSLNRSRNMSGGSWLGKKQWKRKDWEYMQDKDHNLWHGPGPAEFRRVSMRRLSPWRGQQQHLLQRLQALCAQKCSGLKRLTKDPDYRCTRYQGTTRPLDGRPQREVQVGPDKLVGSFLLLSRRHALSSCGCELSTTTRVKPD